MASLFQHLCIEDSLDGVDSDSIVDWSLVHKFVKTMSFEKFIQTKTLSSDLFYAFDNPQTRFVLGCYDRTLTKADVSEAISILEQFTCVGVTEKLPFFISRIVEYAGIGMDCDLPFVRTGPSNRFRPEFASVETLENIFRFVEYDMELYQWTLSRQEHAKLLTLDKPSIRTRFRTELTPICLYDLARMPGRDVTNSLWGTESMVCDDVLVLHAPPPGTGPARITMPETLAEGQSELTAIVEVPDARGPTVLFRIIIVQNEKTIAALAVTVKAGQSCTVSEQFPPIFGPIRIYVSTELSEDASTHEYGTAHFRSAQLRVLQVEPHSGAPTDQHVSIESSIRNPSNEFDRQLESLRADSEEVRRTLEAIRKRMLSAPSLTRS